MIDANDSLASDLDFDFSLPEEDLSETNPAAPDAQNAQDISREQNSINAARRKMSLFSRIPVTLTLEVASAQISLSELMNVNNDSVIELDKLAGEPLDIKVNGIQFGKAEVIVLNDKYGLRIIEFNSKELGELAL